MVALGVGNVVRSSAHSITTPSPVRSSPKLATITISIVAKRKRVSKEKITVAVVTTHIAAKGGEN